MQAEYRKAGSATWIDAPSTWFKGAALDASQTYVVPEYEWQEPSAPPAQEPDYYDNTLWNVQSNKGQKEYIQIFRDGRIIAQSQNYKPGKSPLRFTTGGVTYRRGTGQGSDQPTSNLVNIRYELLIEKPIAGRWVTISAATAQPLRWR